MRRDPFAARPQAAAPRAAAPAFVDAGPPIEIPPEKKGKGKWIAIILAVSMIPLVVGWSCGRIYGARLIFNRTIEDAKKIETALKPIVDTNKKVVQALTQARVRSKGKKLGYDATLVSEVEELLKKAGLKETKNKQNGIFRTNYARMEDLVVQKLFAYYNNTLRLYQKMTEFVDRAKRNQKAIEDYVKATEVTRNYGVVFMADKGGYYLGKLVQIGPPICKDKKKQCKPGEVEGFPVRVGNSKSWNPRPGKPKSLSKIGEIAVPIVPDEDWRQVAAGRPGYLIYRQYALDFAKLLALSALLKADEKELMRGLSKQGKRQKLFAPL
ncbi:MAG: hypothetical protein KC503_46175 [Myxococcales bacterium]|nr:hypothetical protein [Myxococcales bacterium]